LWDRYFYYDKISYIGVIAGTTEPSWLERFLGCYPSSDRDTKVIIVSSTYYVFCGSFHSIKLPPFNLYWLKNEFWGNLELEVNLSKLSQRYFNSVVKLMLEYLFVSMGNLD